jgi:hypothetical protein
MLKKVTIVLSVIAAFGIAFAAPTFAAPNNKNKGTVQKNIHVNRNVNVNRNVHVNRNVNRNVRVNQAGHSNFVVGRRYNGHVWYGHNRHRWHGRWYAYGDGPCWVNVAGEWFWNPIACP